VLSLVAASSSDAKINVTATLDQTEPSVAMDANGDYVVAWNDQIQPGPGYLYDVKARVYNSAGVAQTGEIQVAQTTGDTRPSVAMDASGDFVVAYQVLDANTYLYGITAQRFNLAGTAQGSAIKINDGSSNSATGALPKVAMDSTGDFAIAFQGYDANSHGVFAQRFNASGTAKGSIFRVNTPQNDNQGAPTIAMDTAGDFLIAWLDGGSSQTAGVYAQRYNSSGVAQGLNTPISTVAGASNPSVAMEPTGQFVVAWQFTQSGTSPGIEVQRFDAVGNSLTSVVPVSSPESYSQFSPAVAIDSEGDFVVSWESYGVAGTSSSLATIIAQRVNSAGTLIGTTQFTPSTQSGDSQRAPSIANDPYGDAVIVWGSKPIASSGSQDVYGRLYDHVNDAPTINKPSNVTIDENAAQQTVNLKGITTGGGETQTLKVSASSNNTALTGTLTISYTSPASTATLTFTPAANSFGTATITVTVMDDGGTKNGGVDTTQVPFVVTVNHVAATVTGVSADWGTKGTIALKTAADGLRLLPAGRLNDLPWYGINKLPITLSQAASLSAGDVNVTGLAVANYGPVTISGSGTNYTITFAQAITTADRVTVTIGNAGITTFTGRLDVLPGDANDDGVVNAQDLVAVRNDFALLGSTYNIFDDLNGDGTVDINDTNLVGRFVGKRLPLSPA
jgi:Bacterial Ig domain